MLKIIAIGNITHDLELRTNPHTGKPMLQFQIASTRSYRDQSGVRPSDFVSIKANGALAEQCASWLHKGSKVAVAGDLETFPDQDPDQRNVRFIIKAKAIDFLSPRKAEDGAAAVTQEDVGEVS